MHYTRLLLLTLLSCLQLALFAQIDMQAHVASDEGKVYKDYINEQNAYYTDDYTYANLIALTNDALFGRINTLMGNTCLLKSGYSYERLKDAYKTVDRDLNTSEYIIGYYNGASIHGNWVSGGTTWNREHTWPQSKGAKTGPISYDMQSVRPAQSNINSSRGNKGYGEASGYYEPNEIAISNRNHKTTNLGTYRGDCARVIMYDYLVYGHAGGYQNALHSGTAQLLEKIGSNPVKSDSIVFESLRIMLKWHMQDPPSLTEMVRNDGAQNYQGNRNPLIDYPELAIQVFLDNLKNIEGITAYTVNETSSATMNPAHRYTLSDGFIAYLTNNDGSHPQDIKVTGATTYTYDASLGRLTVSEVTGNMTISDDAGSTPEPEPDPEPDPATYTVTWMANGAVYRTATYNINGTQTISVPAAPTPCDGYTFVGWTTEANYSNPFCQPADLFTSATHKVTTNLTYYAVFKKD